MINLIAATSLNNVIGNKGKMPWYLPDDLKHFRELTSGQTLLMGQNTFESFATDKRIKPVNLGWQRLLRDDRKCFILTQTPNYKVPDGFEVVHSFEEAVSQLKTPELFISGGGMVYRSLISKADRLYITLVEAEFEGDVFFPEIDPKVWKLKKETFHPKDEKHEYSFRFQEYLKY